MYYFQILNFFAAISFFISQWYRGKYKYPQLSREQRLLKTSRSAGTLSISSFFFIKDESKPFSKQTNLYLKVSYFLFGLNMLISFVLLIIMIVQRESIK